MTHLPLALPDEYQSDVIDDSLFRTGETELDQIIFTTHEQKLFGRMSPLPGR
jgi:hypothetical protein